MMVLGIILPVHLINPLISERYGIISLIYAPLIVVAIGVGVYYGNSTDLLRAHHACSCVWAGLMTVGPGLQRLSIYAGLHPRIEPMQAIVYMASYVLVILLWYMMHFDFRHKMYMTAAIFLSLSTAGLEITGDEGWTSLGQPNDTIITGVTIIVGSALGYSIERMLRLSFLQRQSELRSISGAGRQSSMPDIVGDLDELVCPSANVRYAKVGLLGRGGTGDVFLVRQLYRGAGAEEGPLSAMKRISKARLQPAQRERVLEECEILKNISHPFIVRLENAYETQHYFLLEMTYAGWGPHILDGPLHGCDGAASECRGAASARVPARAVDSVPRCEAREHACCARWTRAPCRLWCFEAAVWRHHVQYEHAGRNARVHGPGAGHRGGVLI